MGAGGGRVGGAKKKKKKKKKNKQKKFTETSHNRLSGKTPKVLPFRNSFRYIDVSVTNQKTAHEQTNKKK